MHKKRFLTGDRPTGPLHLGHYFGSLQNRVKLQNDGYEGFVIIADYQVITDRLETEGIEKNILELVRDYLCVGIDPTLSTIFVQSKIPQIAELTTLFSMLVTIPQLERNPTIKEEVKAMGLKDKMSLGMLSYPVSQAADILLFAPDFVPVGIDQAPHIELTREIASRFNRQFKPVFKVPEIMLSPQSRLLGLDGFQKMSKSRGNAISLSDAPDVIREKMKKATTDSESEIYFDEEKRPVVSNLLTLFSLTSGRTVDDIVREYKTSGFRIFKEALGETIIKFLEPMQEWRHALSDKAVKKVVVEGTERAREEAELLMQKAREAMHMGYETIFMK